jgi:phosphohistidine phosphatase
MRLYLMRHAEAAPIGTSGVARDHDRALTDSGYEQARHVAMGLRRLKVPVQAVVSSPYKRAVQTAEQLRRVWGEAVCYQQSNDLCPDSDPRKTLRLLNAFLNCGHLLVVGHEPHLSGWLGVLTCQNSKPAASFKKAGVACVELKTGSLSQGSGELRWLMTGKQLSLIGGAN